jgi:hypothetical protein
MNSPEVNVSRSRTLQLLLLLLVFYVVGGFVPRAVFSDAGVSQFTSDPRQLQAAKQAYTAAWEVYPEAVMMHFLPRFRIEAVEEVPGHCASAEPEDGLASYQVRVRYYSLFNVPGPQVILGCGGRMPVVSTGAAG